MPSRSGSRFKDLVARALSAMDKGYEYLESPPRAPNAKAFQIGALLGGVIMKSRWGPHISKAGRRTYPLALAVFAPAVPKGMNQVVAKTITTPSFLFWFFTTIGFCFGLNAFFSCTAGTFAPPTSVFAAFCASDGSSPAYLGQRLYFIQDAYNIFLYLVIVPAYVAFDIAIIKLFVTTWPDFKNLADNAIQALAEPSAIPDAAVLEINRRVAFFFIVVTLIVVFFITGYIDDILRPATLVNRTYWFVRVTGSGDRVLNSAGAYYLIMNAVLLFLTVTALWCYFGISMELARYAKHIKKSDNESAAVSLKSQSHILLFSQALIFMKVLVALYAVNIFIWSQSPLGAVQNAFVALVALLLVMIVLIPTPRIYLEYRWHALNLFTREGYEDTRTTREKWTTRILDWLVFLLLLVVAKQKYGYSFDQLYDAILAPLKHVWDLILKIFPAS